MRYALSAFALAFSLVVGALSFSCGGSVPADRHAENAAEAILAGAEYQKCLLDARDGGTMESVCECVRKVDAEHRLDAGPCR